MCVKIVSLITLVALVLGALSSCAVIDYISSLGHAHKYEMKHDDTTHWEECKCGNKINEGVHIGGTATCLAQAVCSVCSASWGPLGSHKHARAEYTSAEHWYSCACGDIGERGSHEFVDGVCRCGYLDPVVPHTHKFRLLKYDNVSHWYQCVCGATEEKEAHCGGEATCLSAALCEVCNVRYGELAPHSIATIKKTDTQHSYICSCGKTILTEDHSFVDRTCACGYTLPPPAHTHSFTIQNHNSTSHWNECECGASDEAVFHFGGSADCDSLAVCEGCGESYGEFSHDWNNGEALLKPDGKNPGMVSYTCNLCEEKRTEIVDSDKVIVTRADLEEAIVAAAWAYYMKKDQLQYDSQLPTALEGAYNGISRLTQEVSPEYGTSDTTLYSVCSDYVYKSYLEGIGIRIYEDKYHPNGPATLVHWMVADNQPSGHLAYDTLGKEVVSSNGSFSEPIDDGDRDMAIVRWIDTSKYPTYIETQAFKEFVEIHDVTGSTAFYDWYTDGELRLVKTSSGGYQYYLDGEKVSSATVRNLMQAWVTKQVDGEYVNIRPGDIILFEGHTMMYIGGGRILDCSGNKYDTATGTDKVESNGGIYTRFNTIDWTITGKKNNSFYAIIRALDYYAYDVDGVLGNDIMMYEGESLSVTESTKSRIEYPAMDIDRTVDITPYGTAAKGETLTYTIKITNNTTDSNYKTYRKWKDGDSGYAGEAYKNLSVSEIIPAGTTFLSASAGYVLDGDSLCWTVDVAAGKSVTLTYTVTVTAEIGDIITAEGGYVASIPSNTISNRVGGAKLTGEQVAKLQEIANGGTAALAAYGTDLEFAENIFAELGIELNLASVSELVENLFSAEYFESIKSNGTLYTDRSQGISMFTKDENVSAEYADIAAMIVDGYYGGRRFVDVDIDCANEVGADIDYKLLNGTIVDFRTDFLEAGDILVYAQSSDRGNDTLSNEMAKVWVMIYTGNGTLIEMSLDGTAKVYTGAATTARLVAAYQNTNDIFFLLRPTQVG